MAALYECEVETEDGFQCEVEAPESIASEIETRDLVVAIFDTLSEAQKDAILSRLGGWKPYDY